MTASPDDWRSPPRDWWQQQDRDACRDRLKDAEHTLIDHGHRLDKHEEWQSGTSTKVSWQTAAIGFLAWTLLNKQLAEWTPELASIVAQVLKGLLR